MNSHDIERQQFEAHCQGFSFARDAEGYVDWNTRNAWWVWQARAALATPPQPTERSAELEAVQRDAWVSVGDERKPALGQVILMWVYAEDEGEDDDGRPFNMDKSQVQMGEYRDMGHGPFFDCFATPFADHEGVTHWMPLPPAPIAAPPQKGDK